MRTDVRAELRLEEVRMSLFLLYYDDGPIEDLAGIRGSLVLNPRSVTMRHNGKSVAREVVALTDGVASEVIRATWGAIAAAMRRDVALLIVERLLRGCTPRLLFHNARGEEEPIDVVQQVQVDVMDLAVRVAHIPGAAPPRGQPRAISGAFAYPAMGGLVDSQSNAGSLSDLLCALPYDTLVTVNGIRMRRSEKKAAPARQRRAR